MKLNILVAILFVMLFSTDSFAQKRHGGGRSRGGHAHKAVHPHKHTTAKNTTKLSVNKRKQP